MHDNVDKYFEDMLAQIPPDQMETIMVSLNILKEAISSHQDMNASE